MREASASSRLLLLVAGAWSTAIGATQPTTLDLYLQAVRQQLPTQVSAAFDRIDGTPRRLLAARSYLRAADRLTVKWSWTEEQIAEYERSAERQGLLAEIALVQSRFEQANPGYQLYANTDVRSLDVQLERWNSNPSVAEIAQSLNESAAAELNGRSYSGRPDATGTRRFADFLAKWTPPRAVPLAAPGLSLHGQGRAIDFQVMKDDALVAGTETSRIDDVWSKPGWTRRLREAARGTKFVGPLPQPAEPWHYEYHP